MAKLDTRRIGAFLADPGACRVVLLHGDDPGLIRERCEALIRTVTEGDSLRLVEVGKEALRTPASLANEAASSPLTGGRCLVRLRDAGDGRQAVDAARAALAGPGPGLVVIEAPDLRTSAALFKAVEGSPAGVVIACYRERGAELSASIGRILQELGVSAEPAALEWLAQRLGEDRQGRDAGQHPFEVLLDRAGLRHRPARHLGGPCRDRRVQRPWPSARRRRRRGRPSRR